MAIDLNPTILGRPLFPSSEKLKEYGRTIAGAFTPAAGTPPSTMAGVTVPPAGAPLSQLQFRGPLLGTGPMFGLRGTPAPTPQPEPVKTDIGAYVATRFPFSFDVAKTQTPSMQQPNIAALTGGAQLPSFTPTTQAPIMPPKEPRQMIQTPYGTIYATEQQSSNILMSALAKQRSRTPAEQEVLLAQMRQRGANIMRGNIKAQEQYFAQKRAERGALMASAMEATKSGASPQAIRSANSAYAAAQPSSIAGIGKDFYTARQSKFNPQSAVASVRGMFGLPAGGPQPQQQFTPSSLTTSFANFNPFSNINYPAYNG